METNSTSRSLHDRVPESGPWMIPLQIELGVIRTEEAFFLVDFAVPVRCQLSSHISGIEFQPSILEPGLHTVRMKVSDHPRDTILWGAVEVRADKEVRVVPLHGRLAATRSSDPATETSLFRLGREQRAEFEQAMAPEPPPAHAVEEVEVATENREPRESESPAGENGQ